MGRMIESVGCSTVTVISKLIVNQKLNYCIYTYIYIYIYCALYSLNFNSSWYINGGKLLVLKDVKIVRIKGWWFESVLHFFLF